MEESQDRNQQTADALKALADGQIPEDQPTESSDDLFAPGAGEFDPMSVIDAEPLPAAPQDPAALAEALAETPEARRARQAAIQTNRHRAHAHQFKVFMIPLLLVVGIVLLLCGIGALVMAPAEGVDSAGGYLSREAFHWLSLCCFPVGIILLLGAWLFQRDVKKSG